MGFRWLLPVAITLLTMPAAQAEIVYLGSLEWPPYAGKSLPDGGASVAVAKAAFAAMGDELVVEYYPWSRAVNNAATHGSRQVGYFPEYYSTEVAARFVYSQPMGDGPLGLVEPIDRPLPWTRVDELSGYVIGVVQDYVNTAGFDALVAEHRIATQSVVSDNANVLKVAGGRVDAAVIDHNVLNYLLVHDPQVRAVRDKVHFNARLLENKQLFICFRNDSDGQRWRQVFDEGLRKIDVAGIMARHME